jgi:hypothetical protein
METEIPSFDPEVTVALQGTIETFALPDVMRLLASTKKTGCLRLDGSRGTGSVWVDSGQIVAGEATRAPHADGPVEVVFEMLRFPDGDFVFDSDVKSASPGSPAEVEKVLGEAEALLEEWTAIEKVVPSLESWVALADELPGDEVTLDRERWRLLVAVGGGATVGQVGDRLQMGEIVVSRHVRHLVEQSLATVSDASAGSAAPVAAAPTPDAAAPTPDAETMVLDGSDRDLVEALADDGPAADARFEPFNPDALVIEVDSPADDLDLASTAGEPAEFNGGGLADPSDAAEIARQLANLSPKAAKAVAAAAKATTQEERERALADVDDDEDPINRELLIKFLGSVNG